MKVCAISDTHGLLPKIPECDVLVIAGDILPLEIQRNTIESVGWLAGPFQKWALKQKCKNVVLVAGNHDFIFQELYIKYLGPRQVHDILFQNDKKLKIRYLCDNHTVIGGKMFYGIPWCPELKNWAFYGDHETLEYRAKAIPDCDVLVTHCPPKIGLQGVVLQEDNWNNGRNFGCQEYAEACLVKNIKWVVSGHIHSGNHEVEKFTNTSFVNVSMKDENYNQSYNPFVFEI
jgi:Icc-related predicted phosphoesterase